MSEERISLEVRSPDPITGRPLARIIHEQTRDDGTEVRVEREVSEEDFAAAGALYEEIRRETRGKPFLPRENRKSSPPF